MSVTLLLGDCLQKMKAMPDKSVDCFICDLPYGQLSSKKASKPVMNLTTGNVMPLRTYDGNCDWDIKIDIMEFWNQVKRLCRDDHTPVLMFCNTKFGIELINSNPSWFRYDIVWDKGRGVSFLSANKQPMRSHEMIYVFSKKGSYYKRIDVKTDKGSYVKWGVGAGHSTQYGVTKTVDFNEHGKDGMRCPLSVLNIPQGSKRGGHPTEKPAELYRWLLERYCPAGGTVLDPTAGSFNSVFTARELGLKGIGIEMDRKFFYRAVARAATLQKKCKT